MPNWCNNTVQINHTDPAKMHELVGAINEGKFLNYCRPIPEDLHIVAGRVGDDEDQKQKDLVAQEEVNLAKFNYRNWYDFCVNEWGTKWEVEAYDKVEYDDAHDKHGITFGFDSAWSPPTGAMEYLVDQGFTVKLYYYEPGMAFAGIWEDGEDDCYDIGGYTSETVKESIPEDLDEMFGISECIAEYEEEENENE